MCKVDSYFFLIYNLGALLKAAFVCAEIIDLKSSQTLKEQLEAKYQGGFELHSWTNLPHGSGEIIYKVCIVLVSAYALFRLLTQELFNKFADFPIK